MPNTKSAKRRVRSSERKRVRNVADRSKVKTLEKSYLAAVKSAQAVVDTMSDYLLHHNANTHWS